MQLRLQSLLMIAVLLAAGVAQAEPAQDSSAVYAVTYVDAGPTTADAVAAMLKNFADAARKEDSNVGFIALRETGRPTRFALLEGWRDKAALDARAQKSAGLLGDLEPKLASPFDVRRSLGLTVEGNLDAPADSVVVLTHVDVPANSKDECLALLRQLIEASRNSPGVLRFDLLQQENRANHLTLVEIWRDREAHDAHVMVDATREFRQKLTPIEGALYDERVYSPVQ